jgi:hypothetical protein
MIPVANVLPEDPILIPPVPARTTVDEAPLVEPTVVALPAAPATVKPPEDD